MQDGAVEVKKEPLERPEALEDPKAVAEILVEIRRPKSTIESIVKTLEAEKFEESNIELFAGGSEEFIVDPSIEAIHEAAERVDEEADEITIEEIVIDSIIDNAAGGEGGPRGAAEEGVCSR